MTAQYRIEWLDYAKGLTIMLVVIMHSTLGVEALYGREGWMHEVVLFAKPFRMPAFFLIAGLFLSRAIDKTWRDYADGKIVHFAYFYILWVLIATAMKGVSLYGPDPVALGLHVLKTFIQPWGTLWFIYLLAVFFAVSKLAMHLPRPALLAIAALLSIAPVNTGALVLDKFASYYVFFLAGWVFANQVFAFANWVQREKLLAGLFFVGWVIWNGVMTQNGWHLAPGMPLLMGFVGAFGLITLAQALSAMHGLGFVSHCGQNSLVIYLAFFIPMVVSRVVIGKLLPGLDVGHVAFLVALSAIIAPLILKALIDRIGYGRFLFERPDWAKLATWPRRTKYMPAE